MDTTGFEFENSGFEIVSDDLLQCIYCASLLIFVHHIDATHSLHEHRSYKIGIKRQVFSRNGRFLRSLVVAGMVKCLNRFK